jgi:uncharacterized membrane protein YeaQ/YmgE (transglycosylase-associated protein family)
MEFTITLGLAAWAVLIAGSLIFGVLAQFIGEPRTGYEWLVDAMAFGAGAIVASEFVIGWQAFQPVLDGLAIVPAAIGGLVVGTVVELLTRYLTGGSYAGHQPISA